MAGSDITLVTLFPNCRKRVCMLFLHLQVEQGTDIHSLLELENPFCKEENPSAIVKPNSLMG